MISATIEHRDPYTAGHQQRVRQACELIGRELGLSAERVEGLSLAASIHDVGTSRVPTDILNKPALLSDIERRLVQTHANAGADILAGIETPWPLGAIIRQHHERLDGSGYPESLAGDEILLEARILAVADVLESMANHRPYRAADGVQAALAELRAGAATLYDAEVVAVVERLVEAGALDLVIAADN